MDIPDAVRRFVDAAIVAGDMALPFHYPAPAELPGWQSGFRYHGITGESLIADSAGAWRPGWHVIALNGFDDPFFVDFGEGDQGFPVYYAPHGAGCWTATQIAPDIASFSVTLTALRALDNDDAAICRYIETHCDPDNALWLEISETRREHASRPAEPDAPPPDPEMLRFGALVIIDIGPRKLEVAQLLRKLRGDTLKEVLSLITTPEIEVTRGYLGPLRRVIDRLETLGATIVFRPGDPDA